MRDFLITCLYIIRVAIFSKKSIYRINREKKNNLIVIGNGPSLTKDLIELTKRSEFCYDIMCVNFFYEQEIFLKLRPSYIVFADDYFSDNNLLVIKDFFNQNVNWHISLFLPSQSILPSEKFASNIKIVKYNRLRAVGITKFLSWCYNRGWAVPSGNNVLIPALIHGINMSYKNIFLVGCDHSWLKNLNVDFNNDLIINDRHFYGEKNEVNLMKKKNPPKEGFSIKQQILNFLKLIHSYEKIEEYAQIRNVNIFNCSERTMLDSFRRCKIENIN